MGDTLKRLVGIVLCVGLMVSTWKIAESIELLQSFEVIKTIEPTQLPEEIVVTVNYDTIQSLQEEIRTEIMYGEIELLAQLVEAEAGNQDELGKRYVADVVLNRVDDQSFPDKLEDVIFQQNPIQFASTVDGNFEKAGWNISNESFRVAFEEYTGKRVDPEIIYFKTGGYSTSGTPAFQHGDHYFSRK